MQAEPVIPGSLQWNYSQFRLQLILSHPNIEIISVSKNKNAEKFFQSKDNFFKVDAAIDVTQEKDSQITSLKNNLKKGSTFRCGRIQQQPRLKDGLGNVKVYRMLFFKIAVKNMLPIYQSSSITRNEMLNFFQDYDSIYLSSKKQEITVYDHRYFLKSSSQYVWQYDIEYRYLNASDSASKIKKWNPDSQKCGICKDNKAFWYCVEEKQIFCRQCYDEGHQGKLRKSHQKEHINPFNSHKKCLKSAHNQNPLEFYCFNCKSLKCIKCLSDPNHKLNQLNLSSYGISNQKAFLIQTKRQNHDLAPIRDLIKMFQQKQWEINSQLKQKLADKLRQVEGIILQRTANFHQNLKQLEENLAQSILKLKKACRKQINEAVTVQIELKRKFDEILWIQRFVSSNEDLIDAESNIQLKQLFTEYVTFINAQEYFQKIEAKIATMKAKF